MERGSHRSSIVLLVFALLAGPAPSAAGAAAIPADRYSVNLAEGAVHVGATVPMDFPFASASLGTIDLTGGDRASFRLPVAGRWLAPATAQTPFGPVTLTVVFAEDITGTVTRSTGEVSSHADVAGTITVSGPFGFSCALGTTAAPMSFEPSTRSPGSPFDDRLQATIADDRAVIPALSDCSAGTDASFVNRLVGLPAPAGGSLTSFKLALVSTSATPPGAPQPPTVPSPGSPLPPPVVGIAPRLSIAGANAVVRRGRAMVRLRCVRAARRCSGRLQILPAAPGRALGDAAFAVAPGRTVSVGVPLSRAALAAIYRRGRLDARARATVRGATGAVTRRIVLRGH